MKKRPLWLLTFGICFVFLFMSANTKAATPEKKNAPQAESNQAAQRPQRSENADQHK